MTHYTDLLPAHLLPRQPINWWLAQKGLTPMCWNRPDFPPPMSTDCKAWAVHPSEDPGTESVPAREGWRCWGCRHLPDDPRVVVRAKKSEGL